MKRELLTSIVAQAASDAGYAFHTGEMQTLASTVRQYPAAWLAPPTVKKSTGRTEGEITYRLALHLMTLPAAAPSGASAAEPWSAMERDALLIAADVALSSEVCSIASVACAPARQSLTPHGENSMTLELDVTLWYIA